MLNQSEGYKVLEEIFDSELVTNSKTIHDNQFIFRRAAIGVVKDKDGNIAILHVSKYKFYKLPGGGIEYKEDTKAALKREILEETGTDCKILNKIGLTIECRKEPSETVGMIQISYAYNAEVLGEKGEPKLTDEEKENGYEVIWVSIKEAIKLIKVSTNSEVYESSFITRRDVAILNESFN